MEKAIETFIKLLFPKYEQSSCSRFTKLFQELTENQVFCEQKTIPNKNFDIDISKIQNGNEKRSTIIIKGIPSFFGAKNFYCLLQNFSNKINFFYIPSYISNQKEYMYAFVNLSHNKGIINIVNGLIALKNKYKLFCGFDFSYLEIYFSKTQGYKALKKKYKNELVSDFIIF